MGLLQPKRGGGDGQNMGRAIRWGARGASPDQPRGLFLQQLGAKMSEPTKAQIKAMEWLAAEVGAGWKIGGGRLATALSSRPVGPMGLSSRLRGLVRGRTVG